MKCKARNMPKKIYGKINRMQRKRRLRRIFEKFWQKKAQTKSLSEWS